MTPEGRIEAYLKKRVTETGGEVRKLAWLGRRGAPDRFVWWRGPVFAFVELKRPGGKATIGQKREHAKLRVGGFSVYVIDTHEGVDAFIIEMLS